MANKQQGKSTTPKGAVELKEDALDQASGGKKITGKAAGPGGALGVHQHNQTDLEF